MKRSICLLFILGLLIPAVMQAEKAEKKPAVDHSDPVKIVQAVFEAARNKDMSILPSLCDPKGEHDQDTRRLCEVANHEGGLEMFTKWFGKGKVNGKATIEGDNAKVPFLFGPEGKRKEEMNLVKRDGKWYLSSF
ncbi:MAG: hypothetical protein GY940_12595 [bacterium]|nr:hypothetical protein [bacterium]